MEVVSGRLDETNAMANHNGKLELTWVGKEERPRLDVLRQLETDPASPRLRLHPLKDRHHGKHAVRLTYEYRIVLILRMTAKEIVLLDVGSHDEVYRG